jgi:hypothetical protein
MMDLLRTGRRLKQKPPVTGGSSLMETLKKPDLGEAGEWYR